MIRELTRFFSTRSTPQSQRIPGTRQVRNSAGGYSWEVTHWTRLQRFLILGSADGSYYASPRELTAENGDAVLDCLAEDGDRTVELIASLSESGRAPKNAPAIFALAIALKLGDEATRRAAAEAVGRVCRTGTHLFELAEAVQAFGGWGRATRRAFANWYGREDVRSIAYQAVKYQRRNGWSHRDLLRKAHVRPPTADHDRLFGWICRGDVRGDSEALAPVRAFERAKRASSHREITRLIREHGLVREAIGSQFLNEAVVWDALLERMPMTAMLRNLAKMSQVGLLSRSGAAVRRVVSRLGDRKALRRARIHPLAVLMALNTYQRGRGVRGSLTWPVNPRVADALDRAFELAFECIEPTGKRWMLAVDVSGSMSWSQIAGMTGITPRVAAAAMAMATARTEAECHIGAFSGELVDARVSPGMRLDRVLETFDRIPMGRTDCALPMLDALRRRIEVDAFVVYTDSETWFGKIHPVQALRRYRQAMGIDAKLIVCGMVANQFSIADPDDPGMLDIVGFDTAAPRIMSDFVVG